MPTIACIQVRSIKSLGKNLVDTFLKGIAYEIQNMNCKCAATAYNPLYMYILE